VHEVNNALNPLLAAIYLLDARADDPIAVREITASLKGTAETLAKQSSIMGAVLRHADPSREPTTPSSGTPAEPAADPVTRKQLAASPTSRIRVLIADDAAGDRSLIGEVLTELGYDVVGQATNGDEAVRLVQEVRPDAVLLDVNMPGTGGIEAAERIQSLAREVAVVLFSGDDGLALSERDIAASAALAFLPKPAAPRAIDATLRVAVQRARELRAARAEANDAKQQLANRKIIERAKGILMQRMQISEEAAYKFLQKTSQNRAVPLIEIAKIVIDGEAPAAGK
jgi:response regulator NasT